MGVAHGGARLHAEFVGEAGPQVAVDDEGLGLAAGAVQGEHELAVVGLPQRMLLGEGGQLGHQVGQAVVAQGEFGVVPPLLEQQPRFLEAAHEGVPAHLGGEAAQRSPPPQYERGPALPAHPFPVAVGAGGTGGGDMGVEDLDVQFAVVDAEDVPRGHGEEPKPGSSRRRRRRATWLCSEGSAERGGAPPHRASFSTSTETTRPASSSRTVRRVRSLGLVTGWTGRPPWASSA